MRVLMVEDEKYMAEAVASILRKNHYTVDLKFNGEDGLDCGLTGIYDIIILDIMMPKKNGLEVVKQLRKHKINTPVLLLTAKGDLEDKVNGLDSGADDYLAKPFQTEELLARLRALGRRKSQVVNNGVLEYEDLELNPLTLTLYCRDCEFKLTLKESQLLEMLILNKGIIISKDTIIEKLWGYETEAEDNHVEVYISFLRKKLSNMNSKSQIKTVRGAGYTLAATKEG